MHIVMGSGPDFEGYECFAEGVEVLLPLARKLGIVTANEVNLENLAERIRKEVVGNQSSLITHIVVGAWARI